MAKKKKKKFIQSPVGVAGWTSLHEPSTKYNKDGEYITNVTFNMAQKGVKEFIDKLQETYDNAVRREEEDTDETLSRKFKIRVNEDTGEVTVKFKQKVYDWCKDKNPINFFDSKGNPLKKAPKIGAGSRLVVKAEMSFSAVSGDAFFTLRPQSIQVLKLVEITAGGGMDFVAEEGGYVASASEDDDEDEGFQPVAHDEDDDEDDY